MPNVEGNYPEDDYLPISALNDLLFCERRCAMHRVEQVWVDNVHTIEGTHAHRRADTDGEQSPRGMRTARAVLLKCQRLGLTGKADVIEFHPRPRFDSRPESESRPETESRSESGSGVEAGETPFPVEYKRGKRRRWDNDEVQLCAQALCLEEMLGVPVPAGAIFHIKSKRRREIAFTPELRAMTEDTARRLHELLASAVTPPPVLKARCRGCSLHDLCMPELFSQAGKIKRYEKMLWTVDPAEDTRSPMGRG